MHIGLRLPYKFFMVFVEQYRKKLYKAGHNLLNENAAINKYRFCEETLGLLVGSLFIKIRHIITTLYCQINKLG